MKIVYDSNKKVKNFFSIKEGECFYVSSEENGEDILMKMEELQSMSGYLINAVSLCTGLTYSMVNEDEFEVLDTTLIVNKKLGGENND